LNVNYGFAGHEYLQRLVQPEMVGWIKASIPAWSKSVRIAAGLEDRHRFWIRLIVSVIAAGTIVERMGLLEFSMPRITKWLLEQAAMNRDRIIGAGSTDAISWLSLFMAEYRQDTLVVAKAFSNRDKRVGLVMAPQRQLLCRYELEERKLMISEMHLKRWLVKKSVNIQGFTKQLKKLGVLVGDVRKQTLGAGTDWASGQLPCVSINMGHPAVSGVVASIEEALPGRVPTSREDRIQAMGKL
jgi:hypothetical protein